MADQTELTLWDSAVLEVLPKSAKTPADIVPIARQLSSRERKQVIEAYKAGSYELAVNFIWQKSITALKRELGTLGVQFLGEMLGRVELTDDDDVVDSITEREALRLAEELGVVSSTEAMRLRQTHEIVGHFARLDPTENDDEIAEMDETEAIRSLKACVKNVLGKPKIEVATKFAEFRIALESETLNEKDDRISTLLASPYFFRKLTISVLLSGIKANTGAKLENALANINTILPKVWKGLRDTERWQVGHTYVEVYASGKSTATKGLKEALLKVRGFDYVPENLRSDTFLKAAESLIKAHESFNNFYNEEGPIRALTKLGSTIPTPAFATCASAVLAIALGNSYGASFIAEPIAKDMMDGFTPDRWAYYLNQCLPGDIRIIDKLLYEGPARRWIKLVTKYDLDHINIKNVAVSALISAAGKNDVSKIGSAAIKLREGYYGKTKTK